jgi:uncharacterized damage-inducible protein DinB
MTYYGGKQLANAFRTVRRNTVKIAEEIPEDKYGFRASPDTRSVAQLLTHIALIYRLQHQIHAVEKRTTLEGFNFPAFFGQNAGEEQKPRSKAEIVALLNSEADVWTSWLEGLSDDFLGEQVTSSAAMPQPPRSRFEFLLAPKEHEMHHRGQLMVIQRMLGITPHLTREMMARMDAARARG